MTSSPAFRIRQDLALEVTSWSRAMVTVPALKEGNPVFRAKQLAAGDARAGADFKYAVEDHVSYAIESGGVSAQAPLLVCGVRNNLVNARAVVVIGGSVYAVEGEQPQESRRTYFGLAIENERIRAVELTAAALTSQSMFFSGIPVLWRGLGRDALLDAIYTETADASHLFDIPRGSHPDATADTRNTWSALHETFLAQLSSPRAEAAAALRRAAAGLERADDYLHSILGVTERGTLVNIVAHGRLEDIGERAARLGCTHALCVENSGSVMPTFYRPDKTEKFVPLARAPNFRARGRAALVLELDRATYGSLRNLRDRARTGRSAAAATPVEREGLAREGNLRGLLLFRGPSGYTGLVGTRGRPLEVPDDAKFAHELSRWLRAITEPIDEHRHLKQLCPALYAIRNHPMSAVTFGRTARMLHLLEALLAEQPPATNPYCGERDRLIAATPGLADAIERVRAAHVPVDDTAVVSLSHVLLTAVGYSQCAYFRPYLWEAYGAGQAREDLSAAFSKLNQASRVGEHLLAVVAFLVRYQSAPGQEARNTGSSGFRDVARRICGGPHAHRFSEEQLLGAITVMAVVGEARNQDTPDDRDTPPERRPWWSLTGATDHDSSWKLHGYLSRLMKARNDRAYTWSYASAIGADTSALDEFKTKIEGLSAGKSKGALAFTFDRRESQFGRIRTTLAECVHEVARKPVDLARRFEIDYALTIPDAIELGKPETVVVVKLHEAIAGFEALAPSSIAHGASAPAYAPDHNKLIDQYENTPGLGAARLMSFLFDVAKENFRLSALQLGSPEELYLPTPLMRRLLALIYRLRPSECVLVPLYVDGELADAVPVPKGVADTRNLEALRRAIANSIPAQVLNRAMSQGFNTCDIRFDGLLQMHADSGEFGGRDWRDLIVQCFNDNAYSVLGDRYLRAYNTKRLSYELNDTPRTALVCPTVTEVCSVLAAWRSRRRGLPAVLGIDVGFTFVKFGLFEISDTGELVPVGEEARIVTPLVEFVDEDRAPLPPEEVSKRVDDFAKALVAGIQDAIESDAHDGQASQLARVRVIGVAWPGPVRDNHVAGFSGILRRFGLHMDRSPVESLIGLNVLARIAAHWQAAWNQQVTIGMVNDGTAEGLGLLHAHRHVFDGAHRKRVAVVKLGTGTAGVVFGGGSELPGLAEWGKILLDLAAKFSQAFPSGVANHYLSDRTLKSKAAVIGHRRVKTQEIRSIELGLLLEPDLQRLAPGALSRLIWECGLYELQMKIRAWKKHSTIVDTKLLRQGANPAAGIPRDTLHDLQAFFVMPGRTRVAAAITDEVRHAGAVRLAWLLGIPEVDLLTHYDNPKLPSGVEAALLDGVRLAHQCADSLGSYLGDFVALLHDLYRLDAVIFSGGVLTDHTGELARQRARERLALYDICAESRGAITWLNPRAQSGSPPAHRQAADAANLGAAGAAIHGLAQWIDEKRREGLGSLRLRLQKAQPNEQISTRSGRVFFGPDGTESLDLEAYMLETDHVVRYIESECDALGIHRYKEENGEHHYTRWIV